MLYSLALTACGGGASQPPAKEAAGGNEPAKPAALAESLNVVMHDIYYGESNDNAKNSPMWNVTSGAKVTVNMDNQGVLDHNWAIVKSGEQVSSPYNPASDDAKLLFNAGLLTTKTKKTVDFTAPLPGEYNIVCTVPGHYPVMQGKLVVK
jgi:uncharacterized cupredoxin-like copper-binding protein